MQKNIRWIVFVLIFFCFHFNCKNSIVLLKCCYPDSVSILKRSVSWLSFLKEFKRKQTQKQNQEQKQKPYWTRCRRNQSLAINQKATRKVRKTTILFCFWQSILKN